MSTRANWSALFARTSMGWRRKWRI